MHGDEIIAAIASAPGAGVRGIIRLSGPALDHFLRQLFPSEVLGQGTPRRTQVSLQPESWSAPIPVALHFWPTRRSFTGEPLAELHLPGSPPLINAVLTEAYRHGARAALPGEFTQRAFLNGRIDLLQAEAVLGVIDADSQQTLQQALSQLAGGISGRLGELREELLLHLADLEAGLDFVDEDIEFVNREQLVERLRSVQLDLEALQAQQSQRMTSTGRAQVVLAGMPNAGKSTLFNALCHEAHALVSDVAGTTRDYLQAPVRCGELEIDLIDTAGWEDELLESITVAADQQRDARYVRADLLIWCRACDLSEIQERHDQSRLNSCLDRGFPILLVETKAELALREASQIAAAAPEDPARVVQVSVHTGAGVNELQQVIAARLRELKTDRSELIQSSAARCQHVLHTAIESSIRACTLAEQSAGDELIAVEVRGVLDALGEIVGQVYTDDLLDRIFSRFCIGK
ncbi:MAG: 50S ribosome-binding GTPase [Planctomycetaceae bacterium]|nr:50S ribosome-binding GTPase [Planctomycetaceae bacterium]